VSPVIRADGSSVTRVVAPVSLPTRTPFGSLSFALAAPKAESELASAWTTPSTIVRASITTAPPAVSVPATIVSVS
jgi:hypothetical protein